MNLPSDIGGKTTRTVGLFHVAAPRLARWLKSRYEADPDDGTWTLDLPTWESLEDVVAVLTPQPWPNVRQAVIPLGDWSLFLNNTVSGTDVGVLPQRAARYLGCRAIRAVRIEAGEYLYPGRMLEVYGPEAASDHYNVRSIFAMNDGGRWIFETTGTPFAFEHTDDYRERRKSDRFTGDRLLEYLAALGVPMHLEPTWTDAWLVSHDGPEW